MLSVAALFVAGLGLATAAAGVAARASGAAPRPHTAGHLSRRGPAAVFVAAEGDCGGCDWRGPDVIGRKAAAAAAQIGSAVALAPPEKNYAAPGECAHASAPKLAAASRDVVGRLIGLERARRRILSEFVAAVAAAAALWTGGRR